MILLLDMDGPLADFDRHFYQRCLELGYEFDVDGLDGQRHRFFTEHMVDAVHKREARKLVDSAGWFEGLPVTPGAQEGVRELLDAGHDVWVCTKPLEVNPTCRDAKGAWLREHFPELERKLIIAPDKSLVRGDILLDDAPHLRQIAEAVWRPVVFTAPYNGEESEWAHLPHWTWGDPLEELFDRPFTIAWEENIASMARTVKGTSSRGTVLDDFADDRQFELDQAEHLSRPGDREAAMRRHPSWTDQWADLAEGKVINIGDRTFPVVEHDDVPPGHLYFLTAPPLRRRPIGLSGLAGSGKDTAADALREHDYVVGKFARPLYEAVLTLDPWIRTAMIVPPQTERLSALVRRDGWEHVKRTYPEVRRLLQVMGTEVGRNIIGEDTWVNAADLWYDQQDAPVVWTDMRFPNEVAWLRSRGGLWVHIERPGHEPEGQGHASEGAIDPVEADYVLTNNGTVEELRNALLEIVERER